MDLPVPHGVTWIGGAHPFDLQETYLRFRSPADWALAALPRRADLFITADSRYKLWINGRFLTRGPARSYPQAQKVDQIDVTAYLQTGFNLIAVQVYSPGYSHFAYVHRGMAGLLAWLVCDGRVVLGTTAVWQTKRDPSYNDRVRRVSIYGSGVEVRDLRLAEDWMQPDYAADAWPQARVIAPPGSGPWTGLRPRDLPLLREENIALTLVEVRHGRCPNQPDPHLALSAGWRDAQPVQFSASADNWYQPDMAAGEAVYWLFDLGRDYHCQGQVSVQGAQGGEQIWISYAEKIRDDALVLSDPDTYCRMRLTDRFTLRPGDQTVQGFSMRGGRYLLFGLAATAPVRLRFYARVSQYPLPITRPLAIGDPELDAINRLCETTSHACLQDGLVDSVWRESSQWLGDALPQSLTLWAMSDDTRPMRAVLEMAAQGAEADGILPAVLPGEVYAYTIPRYNFMWVELLQFYAQVTEDYSLVKRLWPVLVKMLTAVDQWRSDEGLVITPYGRRLYIDWSPSSTNEPHAVYNLHYVLALQQAAQLADSLGEAEQAAQWLARVESLRSTTRRFFWRHGRWYDDLEQTTFSQLAAALALLTEAALPAEVPALLDAIASRSLDAGDDHSPDKMVLASPFMHHTIFTALRRHHREDQVVEIIRRRWGRWVQQGCPTTWENWQVDFPDGSQCHAFSAHPRYHLSQIFSVREETYETSRFFT